MKKEPNSFFRELVASDTILIMGILNVTPDSFSDGGMFTEINSATQHALQMISDGADIIDVGGESSRPGAEIVSVQEEIKRTIPVIENILKINPEIVISIDTRKPEVAEEALKKGVKIINDISGLRNPEMLNVIKKYNATVIIMHMLGEPQTMQANPEYKNVVTDIYDYLKSKIELARKNGIDAIVVDPGIGFGKRVEDNYELLKNLTKFQTLDAPILIGVSRKSLIGNVLNIEVNERDVATVILETAAVDRGAKIIRTHNVKNGVQLKELYRLL